MARAASRLGTAGALVLAVSAILLLCATALAQQQAGGPPQPDLRRGAPAWVGFVIIFLLTALVMAVSLMPSKRGHQD